ncbi:unnamed protein product, partial [Phaeothamnion confervicola]
PSSSRDSARSASRDTSPRGAMRLSRTSSSRSVAPPSDVPRALQQRASSLAPPPPSERLRLSSGGDASGVLRTKVSYGSNPDIGYPSGGADNSRISSRGSRRESFGATNGEFGGISSSSSSSGGGSSSGGCSGEHFGDGGGGSSSSAYVRSSVGSRRTVEGNNYGRDSVSNQHSNLDGTRRQRDAEPQCLATGLMSAASASIAAATPSYSGRPFSRNSPSSKAESEPRESRNRALPQISQGEAATTAAAGA